MKRAFPSDIFFLYIIIILAAALLLLPVKGFCPVQEAQPDPGNGIVKGEAAQKMDDYLNRITPFGFSGALLAAVDGEIVLNKGYGLAIRSENIPNTSDTVFSTGSITKQFTAAGIMKLEMMGKLDTSDPLTEFFENVPEDKRTITLHHLLTHASGVVNFTGPDYVQAERDETVKKILEAPLEFKPGDRFEYSNAGYSMLAAVIEKVSGQAYEEFLHEHLFKPAGMEFTGYRLPDWTKKVVAHWYVGEKDNGTPLEKPYPFWNILGNGGILSTTADMYKWHLALLGDKVLSAEARKKIFTPYLNDYGYGWDVLQTERGLLIQHDGGSMLGSSSEFRRYIDAGVVTMLFCNQSFGRTTLMEVLRDKVETLVFGGSVETPPAVQVLKPEALEPYAGSYQLAGGGKLRVNSVGGKLVVAAEGQEAVSALFGVNQDEAGEYEKLSALSLEIFQAALQGDFKPFGKVLFNREQRMAPVKELVEMRLRRYAERTGDISDVISRLTLPTEFRGERAAQTFVECKGERGSIFFLLYWKNGMNVGVAPAMDIPDITVPFLAAEENAFAGYHLAMARNFRIRFESDMQGGIIRLVLQTTTGEIPATRKQDTG